MLQLYSQVGSAKDEASVVGGSLRELNIGRTFKTSRIATLLARYSLRVTWPNTTGLGENARSKQ